MIKTIKNHIIVIAAVNLLIISVIMLVVAYMNSGTTSVKQVASQPNNRLIAKANEPVTIEIFSPEVWVQAPGAATESEAKDRQEIEPGSKVRTGKTGRAQIWYPNHTVTRLNYNTQIILKSYAAQPQQVSVHIITGEIWSRIAKLLGGESYETETDVTIATVRGTAYGMSKSSDGNDVITVRSGKVSVEYGNAGGLPTASPQNPIYLPAYTRGFFPSLKKTKPIIDRLDAKEMNNEWMNFNEEQDKTLEDTYVGDFAKEAGTATPAVLGNSTATVQSIPTSPPNATPTINLIDCTIPDGATFKATPDDCSGLNVYWATHPSPTPNPTPTSNVIAHISNSPVPTQRPTTVPSATTAPTAVPTNAPTAVPTVIVPTPTQTRSNPLLALAMLFSSVPADTGGGVLDNGINPTDLTFMVNGSDLDQVTGIKLRYSNGQTYDMTLNDPSSEAIMVTGRVMYGCGDYDILLVTSTGTITSETKLQLDACPAVTPTPELLLP